MADNAITPLGRFNLIDPNSFGNQTNTGSVFNKELGEDMFSENNYNISVPLEDLCISVELETEAKTRTILSTNNGNSVINTQGNNVTVKFIGGTNEKKSTDNANENINLTTSYTDIFSQNEPIEEALGITSIDIDFSSSYTPMVNINFIDIKGAAIFQSQGNSKYSVFFNLPYPLFRLKVKGYYGKPVVYCLHLIKFNSKFNSQTGNFEITTQFIGYTYAMLSDMIMGLVKPASLTTRGQELLKARGVIDIPTFEKRVGEINTLIKNEVLTANDTDVMSLNKTQELINKLKTEVLTLIDGTISKFTTNFGANIVNKNKDDINVSLGNPNLAIVILNIDYNTPVNNLTTKEIFNQFQDDLTKLKNDFNNNLGDYKSNQKISLENWCYSFSENIPITAFTSTDTTFITNKFNSDRLSFGGNNITIDNNNINEYLAPYKNALEGQTSQTSINSFNFTRIIKEVNESIKELEKIQETTKTNIAIKLNEKLKKELGFDMTIRNIFNLLTTNVEVFLQQLLEVSQQSQKSTDRTTELSNKFKNNTTGTGIDVPKKFIEKNTFLPWPEYYENGEEKYLATALDTPSNVNEIKFVEDLFIIQQTKLKQLEDSAKNLLEENPIINQAFTPLDSNYYNKGEKNPYDRLDNNANGDDIATLILLRAIGLLGFGNNGNYITDDEIKSFAKSDVNFILDKFSINKEIIGYLNSSYGKAERYLEKIDKPFTGSNIQKILNKSNDKYNYDYIKQGTAWTNGNYPAVLPITFPFNKVESNIDTYLFTDTNSKGKPIYRLSNFKYNEPNGLPINKINFIEIIDKNLYDNGGKSSPAINFDNFSSPDDSFKPKDSNFQIGSGRFGVQDFVTVDYSTSGEKTTSTSKSANFYTVFYDEPVIGRVRGTVNSLTGKKTKRNATNIKDGYTISINIVAAKDENYLYNLYSNFSGYRENNGKNRAFLNSQVESHYPFVTFGIKNKAILKNFNNGIFDLPISLFGSRLYNAQTLIGKTFLFLHTFPWTELIGNIKTENNPEGINTSFKSNFYLLRCFKYYTGFVQVPYLYTAFIGGLIYRLENNEDILKFIGYDGTKLVPDYDGNLTFPTKSQYLTDGAGVGTRNMPMDFTGDYLNLPQEIINLPYNVKEQFKSEFLKFTEVFDKNKGNFEIKSKYGDGDENWVKSFNEFILGIKVNGVEVFEKIPNEPLFKRKSYADKLGDLANFIITPFKDYLSVLKTPENNSVSVFDTFTTVLPYDDDKSNDGYSLNKDYNKLNYNYFIEYSDTSEASKQIVTWMKDYKYIINNSWMIWDKNRTNYETVSINENKLTIYLTEIITSIKTKNEELTTYKFSDKKFEDLKFEMYRTLKKINDKWTSLSDTDSTKMFFQCCKGDEKRLPNDTTLAEHRTGNKGETPRLIDSFRFVDRAFCDIGDELAINPFTVVKLLLDNSGNTSLADLISRILSDNNMEFIALPNFINYNKAEELMTVFKPYPYYEANKLIETGPSFVCVYIGQTSTKLDFSDNQNFEFDNDGFDFTKDGTRLPSDFTETPESWEDFGAAFLVNYGHQNQNIFKDVRLDQAEFSETIESLSITDQLINNPNNIYAGQNLYNIYSTRSYKAEVEMLGDAMIQPMMYFQLNNIPMFHGGYLITKVKHSIVPNHMTTTFTGTRIKDKRTPLVDVTKLFKDILNNYDLPKSTTNTPLKTVTPMEGSRVTRGSLAPIVATIYKNGGSNGDIAKGNITRSSIIFPSGILNNVNGESIEILTEAVEPLKLMLTEWVKWMKDNGFKGENSKGNIYAYINSAFRTYQQQEEIKKTRGSSAAIPGTSRHGWGIAIDLQYFNKNGNLINNYAGKSPNVSVGFDFEKNPAIVWLLDNSYRFGWIIPSELRDNSGLEEFWHWEYHGTSAKCILEKNTNIKGHVVTVDKNYDPSVKNPKNLDKTVAVYTDCNFTSAKQLDGGQLGISKSLPKVNEVFSSNVTYYAPGKGRTAQEKAIESGIQDKKGKIINTLEDYLEGKSNFVSVAMDGRFTYGTKLTNENFKYENKLIPFEIRDTGGAFTNAGGSKIDIPTREISIANGKDPKIKNILWPNGITDGWKILT